MHSNRADEFIITRNPYKQFDIVGYAKLKTWAKVIKNKSVQQILAAEFIEKDGKVGVFNDYNFMKGPITLDNGKWWDALTHIFNKFDYLEGVPDEEDDDYDDDPHSLALVDGDQEQYSDYLKNNMNEWAFLKFKNDVIGINEKDLVVPRGLFSTTTTLPDFHEVLKTDPVVFEKMLQEDSPFIFIADKYKNPEHNKTLNYYPNIIFEPGTETEKDKIHFVAETEFLKYIKRKSLDEPELDKKLQTFLEAKTVDDRVKLKAKSFEDQQRMKHIRGLRKWEWDQGKMKNMFML